MNTSRYNKAVVLSAVVSLFMTAGGLVSLATGDRYVNWNNPFPAEPYDSWENAANTIQDAIDQTSAGATVWVENGIYDTGGKAVSGYNILNRILISEDITVRSVNGPEETFIVGAADPGTEGCGPAAERCAWVSVGTLIGFTLTNGFTLAAGNDTYERTAGGLFLTANGVVSNCVVSGSTASYGGGGIYVYSSGTVTDCRILGNEALEEEQSGRGGGILVSDPSASGPQAFVTRTLVAENTSFGSGGGVAFNTGNGLMNDCTVSNNVCTMFGGGGVTLNGARIQNSLIIGNTSGSRGGSGGGGVNVEGAASIVSNCIIQGNSCVTTAGSSGIGGGIRLGTGGLATHCIISENNSHHGGGAAVHHGNLVKSIVSNNQSTAFGGGVYQQSGSGMTSECLITHNTSGDGGGGVWPTGGLVERCIITKNKDTSSNGGGGVSFRRDSDSRGFVYSCLIYDNSARRGAGVVFTGKGTLVNCTIVSNTLSVTDVVGAGVFVRSTYAVMVNNIIWGNHRSNGVLNNYRLYEADYPAMTNMYNCTTPIMAGDGNISDYPRFIDFDNGDYSLHTRSPCVNRGTYFAWMDDALDMAGNPRLMDVAVDMGAYETIPPPVGTMLQLR